MAEPDFELMAQQIADHLAQCEGAADREMACWNWVRLGALNMARVMGVEHAQHVLERASAMIGDDPTGRPPKPLRPN